MTSKIHLLSFLAIAAVLIGSVSVGTVAFADDDDDDKKKKKDKKNDFLGIIAALEAIADAINGIDPNVTVDTPITVEVPADSIQVEVVGLSGPDGDKGETGDKGPIGDKGPDGDPGTGSTLPLLESRIRVSDYVDVDPGRLGQAVATCEAGETMTGGGITISSQNWIDGQFRMSKPGSSISWVGQIHNTNADGGDIITIQANVMCAKLTP